MATRGRLCAWESFWRVFWYAIPSLEVARGSRWNFVFIWILALDSCGFGESGSVRQTKALWRWNAGSLGASLVEVSEEA